MSVTFLAEPVEQACLLCRSNSYRPVKVFPDGVLVGECQSCGLLYTPRRHPLPEGLLSGMDLEGLRTLYRPIVDGRCRHFRQRSYDEYLAIIARHAPGRRLLDVGCAHGFFLRTARTRGWTVTGIEPSEPMAAFARQELGLDVHHGRLDQVDLGDGVWDAVSFTDSAEYLTRPLDDLGRIVSHLAPSGVLFMKVPNGSYFLMRHRFERWLAFGAPGRDAFSPSQRVAHYTAATLRRLAEAIGLHVIGLHSIAPVDSSCWSRCTGLPLEVEAPWFFDVIPRLLRRTLHVAGSVEMAVLGDANHLSPSLHLIARRVM